MNFWFTFIMILLPISLYHDQVIFSFDQMALLPTFVYLSQEYIWLNAVDHWGSFHSEDDHGCLTYMARSRSHIGREDNMEMSDLKH